MQDATFTQLTKEEVYQVLGGVMDPEIPVLSLVKMGIVHDVRVSEEGVEVDLVPTFAGCPAIGMMKQDVEKQLLDAGAKSVVVRVLYKQSWSTNQMSPEGKKDLKSFGISPPPAYDGELTMEVLEQVSCPLCDSSDTKLLNSFGPTACRSIHHCNSCHETFEQMKPL